MTDDKENGVHKVADENVDISKPSWYVPQNLT